MDLKRVKAQFYSNKRRAKTWQVENTLTWQEWAEILRASNGYCAYCKRNIGIDSLVLEHKIPLSKLGPNSAENVAASCPRCNSLKSTHEPNIKFNAEDLPFLNPLTYSTIRSIAIAAKCDESRIKAMIKKGKIIPIGLSLNCKKSLLFDKSTLEYTVKEISEEDKQAEIYSSSCAYRTREFTTMELITALETRGYKVSVEKIKENQNEGNYLLD